MRDNDKAFLLHLLAGIPIGLAALILFPSYGDTWKAIVWMFCMIMFVTLKIAAEKFS